MKMSKKMKRQLKTKMVSTILATLAIVVLVFACSKIDNMAKILSSSTQQDIKDSLAKNSIEEVRTSDGINLKITGVSDNGVKSLQVYQGNSKIADYTYADNNTQKQENIKVTVPFGENANIILKINGIVVAQQQVTNNRYIYTAQDLKKFASLVNAGNTFEGKYIELTNDIDLSTVCSETIGSWTPIGTSSRQFKGNFDGNGYSISNIYYNGNDRFSGLFAYNNGMISNLVIKNSTLKNTGWTSNTQIGGIVGYNRSIIRNCIVENTVTVSITGNIATYAGGIAGISYGYIADCVNKGTISGETTGNIYNMAGGIAAAVIKDSTINSLDQSLLGVIERCHNAGSVTMKSASTTEHNAAHSAGIAGQARDGAIIRQCYNTGSVTAVGNASHPSTGGIGGLIQTASIIEDCYNLGTIKFTSTKSVNSRVGGITGSVDESVILRNCYNIGTTSSGSAGANRNGGVTGCVQMGGTMNNCYALSGKGASAVYGQKISATVTNSSMKTDTQLKSLVSTLGSNWIADSYGLNSGYPILKWQIPEYELNVKQTYLKVGEQLQLNIDTSKTTVAIGNITWTSYDETVAKVDSNGKVTAIGEGFTTVYAKESKYGLMAMAVINVSKQNTETYAQIENGDRYTVILKEDGTVWATGYNVVGQLGDGSIINSTEPVQVKTSDKEYLTNVIKISVGINHTLALTKDGEVYAWGGNTYGQLGNNSTENKYYASRVLDVDGTGYLNNIVDISAGSAFSTFLKNDGNVYSVGYNLDGRLGIGNLAHQQIAKEALISDIIDIASGNGNEIALKTNGRIYGWGYNGNGQLALNNTVNQSIPQLSTGANTVEISASGYTTLAKVTTGEVYGVGYNGKGQMPGLAAKSHSNYQKITLPSQVTGSVKVKHIYSSVNNTTLLLTDGTIWTSGENVSGQIGTGDTTTYTSFVQVKDKNGNIVKGVTNVGKIQQAYNTTAYNLSYILSDGYVYSAGDNTYGQLGNGTTTNSTYYTQMGVPYLNYQDKEITIKVNGTYKIDKTKLKIENEFNTDIDFVPTSVGSLTVRTENSDKITISDTGVITGIAEGYAKVKITDTTNGYETYITVKVVNKNSKLELGSKFSVGLRSDGTVWTWGSNIYGELGTNSNESYIDEPKELKNLSNIVDIGAGDYHAVALNNNGEVYTWGLNNNGQLGLGNTTNTKEPVKVAGLSNIVKVDAYKYITVALDKDGYVYVCGQGYGNSFEKLEYIPGKVVNISEDIVLTENGRIYRLDGSMVHNTRNVEKISSYDNQIMAVLGSGKIVNISDTEVITTYSIENAVEVSSGNGYSMIMDQAQNVYTLGKNDTYQLANGTNTEVTVPTKIETTNAEIIAASEGGHTGIVNYEGYIYTAGLNDNGQLGHGNIDTIPNLEVILNVAIESNVEKIVQQIGESEIVDIGLGITLNLKKDLTQDAETNIEIVDDTIAKLTKNADGTYTVTGKNIGRTFLNATIIGNIYGELKQFATNVEVRIVPEGAITIPSLASGEDFSVALKADGSIETWGKNNFGQLGLGNTINYDEPQEIEKIEETIVEIVAGNSHVLALGESGKIYAWGLNTSGQVGNGTIANQVEQATVINIYGNELSKIIRVEAHGDNSFAINEDGQVFAWGKDFGTKAKQLTELNNVIDVSTSYFVQADGTVYNMTTLEKLAIVGKIRIMDEGTDHTIFLTTDGKAYGIGSNMFGQLGNGNTESSFAEVVAIRKDAENIFENILGVQAGNRYSVILTTDGKVYTTGINENGQQGIEIGETTDISIPRQNTYLQDVMLISSGKNHIVVAKTDGTTYSWGKGQNGELGNRQIKDSIKPVMVGEYLIRLDKKQLVQGKNDETIIKAYVDYFNILNNEIIPISYATKNSSVATVTAISNADGKLTQEEIEKGYFAAKVKGIDNGTTNIVLTESKTNSIGIIQTEILPEEGITISPMVETTGSHTVTLKTNGTVWTYGQNTYGQLGIGTLEIEDEPHQVIFEQEETTEDGETAESGKITEEIKIIQVVSGENHSAALDSQGNVWLWGRNNYYQLGVSGLSYSATPIKLTGIPKVTRIASGNNSIMVVTENNKLYAWGQNAYGELGTGEYSNKTLPTVIDGVHDVLDIKGGKSHYILLKTNGDIYTVGSNLYSQLGMDLGEKTRINTFEKVDLPLKIGSISAGWTSNMAVTLDGQVYAWGQNIYGNLGNGTKENILLPTKLDNVKNIVDASVGKVHTILRDFNGEIYLAGTNLYGQLGNATTNNNYTFTKNTRIEDILRISAGNTYSVVMKEDGQVWAWGDYNHGNRSLKSRTNAKIPVQIGSDTSSLENLEVIVRKSEIASVLANSEFSFNLIYENENSTSDFSYESLNTNIATVDEDGDILGIREGTTWVKVVDKETGKVNVAIIRVIDNVDGYTTYTAPQVEVGEDFVVSLKEEGSIDIWGYEAGGLVDSSIPTDINVVETYTDIEVGKNFVIALRNDGTVWAAGNNDKGQLGNGKTTKENKLIQVPNLTDIEKIAVGDEFAIAIDSYGLIYVWGEGYTLRPERLEIELRTISYLTAGDKDQIIMILPTGEVYGIGSILNGTIENLENAVKVEVGEGYLLILNTNGEVLKYENGTLTKISAQNAIDISVKGNTNMYQDISEKAYVWGDNTYGQAGINGTSAEITTPVKPNIHSENVFSIAAGYKNTYITKTTGFIYSAGDNIYGEIGDGTRDDINAISYGQSLEHTLVGDRNFEIKPISAILEINDIEDLEIGGNVYNVFRNQKEKDISEYDIVSKDSSIVEVLSDSESNLTGELKALTEGTTTIDVTDKTTGQKLTLTRKIVPLDQNRIKNITVNGNDAEAQESSDADRYIAGYVVEVPLDDNETEGTLIIQTNNLTDKISIDDDVTFVEGGTLTEIVTIGEEELIIPIKLQTSNGTEFEYELTVKRVSNNNNIKNITVNGCKAEKSLTEENTYEIIITNKETNEVIVNSEDENALISINGLSGENGTKKYNAKITKGYLELPIKVTSESGKVENSTLKIYTTDYVLGLKNVTVNDNKAILENDGTYKTIILDDINRSNITATTIYENAFVGINNSEKEITTITKGTITTENEIQVKIQTQLTAVIDGIEQIVSKTHILKIYKNKVFSLLEYVKVNGEKIEEENETYTSYVLSNTEEVDIEIKAKDSSDVIILGEDSNTENLQITKQITEQETIYTISVLDESGTSKEYTLVIIRGETDTGISKITVGNGEYIVKAEKLDEKINGKDVYEAKILEEYTNVDITVQTVNKTSKISINSNLEFAVKQAIENMELTEKVTLVPITVKTEDEATSKEYVLRILRQEDNTDLDYITVDENVGEEAITATLVQEGNEENAHYEVYLQNATNEVTIDAKTISELSSISINEEEKTLSNATLTLDLTSSQTEVEIKVTSEAETEKIYYLTIYTISDDTSIENITVDGIDANWNNITKRYEIKVDRDLSNYEVTATTVDEDAKVNIAGAEGINTVSTQVSNELEETVVDINVTAPNNISSKTYKLAIIEKSNNSNLGYVKVNGTVIAPEDDGNYKLEVVSAVKSVLIEVASEEPNASIKLDEESQIGVWKNTKVLQTDEETFEVQITAEDGVTVSDTYTITIIRLDGNTDIEKIEVAYTHKDVETTNIPVLQEDGSYYIKIPRVDKVNLSIELEQDTSKVNILGTEQYKAIELEQAILQESLIVPIIITAEDGTKYETSLTIEKMSNDTSLQEVSILEGEITKLEANNQMMIDSKVENVTLTAIPTIAEAKVKISEDTDYQSTLNGVNVDITGKNEIILEVLAEDGETIKEHNVQIIRTYDADISNLAINEVEANLEQDVINLISGDKAEIVITAKQEDTEIYLVKDGVEIGAGIGTLNISEDILTEGIENYTIKVQGPDEYSIYSKEFALNIRKKSSNNNAMITVNDTLIELNEETEKYEAIVAQEENILKVIKENENATISIDSEDAIEATYLMNPKETKQIKVIVTAENGETKEYIVEIYRKNNDAEIESVKLVLSEGEEAENLVKQENGTYYKKVKRNQTSVTVTLTANDENAIASIAEAEDVSSVTDTINITDEITKVPLKITAEDGTEYSTELVIEKESNDASLKEVASTDGKVTKENDIYTLTVDSRVEEIKLVAKPTNQNATIKLSEDTEYVSILNGVSVDITGKDEIIVDVLAEDKETKLSHTIQINRTFDTSIKEVKVNGEDASKENDSYKAWINANSVNNTILIKTDNEEAVITIYNGEVELANSVGTLEITDDMLDETKTYKVKVKGPTGYEKFETEYDLEISKKSTDTSMKIYVNDTELTKNVESGKYTITTKTLNNVLKVETTNEYAKISINGKPAVAHEAISTYQINSGDTKQIRVVITSQNGEQEESIVEIVRLSNNTKIQEILVNEKVPTKVTTGNYRSVQDKAETNAHVKITLEDSLAEISANINGTNYEGMGTLEFNVPLTGTSTEKVELVVTAQDGTISTSELNIIQNISTNINFVAKVDDIVAQKLDEFTYRIFVDHNTANQVNVEITSEDEYTTIESGEYIGNTINFSQDLSGEMAEVMFTVTAESGESKDCVLYIIRESDDNSISNIYVNGQEVEKGENGRYTVYIENTFGDPEVKVVTNNEYAYVRIGTFEEQARETTRIVELAETRTTTVPITVRSQSGENNVEYLDIIVTFVIGNIDAIIVDDEEITNYNESTKTYVALVENNIEEHEIYVVSDNNYVTLELADAIGMGSVTSLVKFDEGEEVKELTLYVTGETDLTETYTIVLAQKSSNTNIKELRVNDVTLMPKENTNYYYKNIDKFAEKAKVEVVTEYPYATIKVGDTEVKTGKTGEVFVNLKLDEDEITIPVLVTATDGTTIETYNIILTRTANVIKGNVITENTEDKHIANVKVYRSSDTREIDDLLNPRELVTEVVTNENGEYIIYVTSIEEYDIVIEKEGYLDTIVTNIMPIYDDEVTVQDIKLIAGDIDGTNEINIFDLVGFNDNYGVVITDENKENKSIYDLNEDGVVDNLDRNILKGNYGKLAETVEWINPNAENQVSVMSLRNTEEEDFILPMSCEYTITSEYGMRVHPITGEQKKHTGIDISGVHHTEIFAVADGEVTFAGVQNGYGNCIEIKHIVNGETIYSFYAHLSRIDVQAGDTVEQGEIIGLEGGDPETDPNPGSSTGHHLHFEIRTASGYGNDVNPSDYIKF